MPLTMETYFTMSCMDPSINQIAPNLFVGNVKSSLKRQVLRENNITAVVSLLDGGYERWNHPEYRAIIPKACHLYVPCLDNSTMDILVLLDKICDFIDVQLSRHEPLQLSSTTTSTASTPMDELDQDIVLQQGAETPREPNVLIHCRLGISRSATVAIAYLMRKRNEGLDSIYSQVRQRRNVVRPRDTFIEQLRIWEAVKHNIWADGAKTMPKHEYRSYLDTRAVRLKAKGLTGNEPFGMILN
ncbi:protein-tyrosine phosphatase-like protein [Thelonectria olida]|uniref:protein-tyrosine-phosphatase n=1 Tax=Thelonectria olida TaxID=1576542 RepID=A0A9P8WH26_9HYPO|nr:protein-tyrosine phosphatase-like protein [Thelonectria olida]